MATLAFPVLLWSLSALALSSTVRMVLDIVWEWLDRRWEDAHFSE